MGIVGTASGSGSGSQPGDSTSVGEAGSVLNLAAANGVVQPPKVTLTIELGTLTPESIAAICNFIGSTLAVGAAMSIGAASGAAPAAKQNEKAK